jgi:hypothetical protein
VLRSLIRTSKYMPSWSTADLDVPAAKICGPVTVRFGCVDVVRVHLEIAHVRDGRVDPGRCHQSQILKWGLSRGKSGGVAP